MIELGAPELHGYPHATQAFLAEREAQRRRRDDGSLETRIVRPDRCRNARGEILQETGGLADNATGHSMWMPLAVRNDLAEIGRPAGGDERREAASGKAEGADTVRVDPRVARPFRDHIVGELL